jgi:hypothetical protein
LNLSPTAFLCLVMEPFEAITVMIFFLKLMLEWEVEMMMMTMMMTTVINNFYWENWNNLVILKKKNRTLCLNSCWKGSSVILFWMAALL